jgi:hypothetical protein
MWKKDRLPWTSITWTLKKTERKDLKVGTVEQENPKTWIRKKPALIKDSLNLEGKSEYLKKGQITFEQKS